MAEVFWLKNRAEEPIFISDSLLSQTAFIFNDKRFLVLTNSIPKRFRSQQKLGVENLIISRKIYVDSLLFSRFDRLETVLVTDNVPQYVHKRVEKEWSDFSVR